MRNDTHRNVLPFAPVALSAAIDPDLLEACREFRALRRELYSSQLEAAAGLGKGYATIARIESYRSDPPYSLICRMRRLVASKKEAA